MVLKKAYCVRMYVALLYRNIVNSMNVTSPHLFEGTYTTHCEDMNCSQMKTLFSRSEGDTNYKKIIHLHLVYLLTMPNALYFYFFNFFFKFIYLFFNTVFRITFLLH